MLIQYKRKLRFKNKNCILVDLWVPFLKVVFWVLSLTELHIPKIILLLILIFIVDANVDTTTLEFYAYSTSLQYTKALLVNTNSYQVLTFTPLKSDLAPL